MGWWWFLRLRSSSLLQHGELFRQQIQFLRQRFDFRPLARDNGGQFLNRPLLLSSKRFKFFNTVFQNEYLVAGRAKIVESVGVEGGQLGISKSLC